MYVAMNLAAHAFAMRYQRWNVFDVEGDEIDKTEKRGTSLKKRQEAADDFQKNLFDLEIYTLLFWYI